MKSESHKPYSDDTFVLVDYHHLDDQVSNLPLNDTQVHYAGKETVGVWKIKGRKYNSFKSIYKLVLHINPFKLQ